MSNEEESRKSGVEFIEEWQTGFFLILGSVIGGFVIVGLFGSFLEPRGNMVAFFAGAILTFVVTSSLLYGNSA